MLLVVGILFSHSNLTHFLLEKTGKFHEINSLKVEEVLYCSENLGGWPCRGSGEGGGAGEFSNICNKFLEKIGKCII